MDRLSKLILPSPTQPCTASIRGRRSSPEQFSTHRRVIAVPAVGLDALPGAVVQSPILETFVVDSRSGIEPIWAEGVVAQG